MSDKIKNLYENTIKDLLNDERINTTKFAERNIYAKGMEYLQRQKLV